MGKKKGVRATPMKIPELFLYSIGLLKSDNQLAVIEVEATKIENDMDSLIIYDYVGHSEQIIGRFNTWSFYILRDRLDRSDMNRAEASLNSKDSVLPKGWGEVK